METHSLINMSYIKITKTHNVKHDLAILNPDFSFFKLHDWFESYSNFVRLGKLYLVVEFNQGGPATKGATSSSFH